MADFGMLNCFSLWNLAVVFVCYTLSDIGSVYGGPFLYIPYNGTRPNNTVAREVCKSYRNCELAVIDTQSEYDRMYDYFNDTLGENFTLPTAFWIGLYWIDVTGLGNYTHFWEKSGQLEELTWSYWDGGEPNGPGSEDCARIHTNMYMRTIQCYDTYDILCEGTGRSGCGKGDKKKTECEMFAKCWWTPARVGLTSGFTSLTVFFILCCLGWKYCCAPRAKVGYEQDDDDEEVYNYDGKVGAVHNIMKNHNIDHMPAEHPAPQGINSIILNKRDNSWMTPEELSFSARYAYKH